VVVVTGVLSLLWKQTKKKKQARFVKGESHVAFVSWALDPARVPVVVVVCYEPAGTLVTSGFYANYQRVWIDKTDGRGCSLAARVLSDAPFSHP